MMYHEDAHQTTDRVRRRMYQKDPPQEEDPGPATDLGRRIAHRRADLGLSRQQLAAAAGMARPYVDYLEEQPAIVGPDALIRLSDALATTPAALLGADPRPPPAGLYPAPAGAGHPSRPQDQGP
ncbi:MAG TPA: helix-turn-helix transcriptional regulator [Streptosporangiaceae bacterium]|nr:helix-turn-helix transcriptional regulator [Streptosporangiaceae bacterium]